jgi:hypothetical protein
LLHAHFDQPYRGCCRPVLNRHTHPTKSDVPFRPGVQQIFYPSAGLMILSI